MVWFEKKSVVEIADAEQHGWFEHAAQTGEVFEGGADGAFVALVRRKYERGGADAVGGILNHAGDADVVFGHHGGDASEDAGLVFYRETNVVAAANTLGRSEAAIGARGGRVVAHVVRAFAVTEQRDRIGDVADDGAGGSVLARAAADIKRGADDVARDGDRVEDAADVGEDVALGQQRGLHADTDFVGREITGDNREQLDAVAEGVNRKL